MRRLAAIVGLAAAAHLAAACNPVPPPPGPYAGPKPSVAAQHELGSITGSSVTFTKGPLAGDAWVVEGFWIIDNDVSRGGRGPVLRVRRGGRVEHIPVENDADVADLRFRALGTGDAKAGRLSAAYKARAGL